MIKKFIILVFSKTFSQSANLRVHFLLHRRSDLNKLEPKMNEEAINLNENNDDCNDYFLEKNNNKTNDLKVSLSQKFVCNY